MTLNKYRSKRTFEKTPEPEAILKKSGSKSGQLVFVVQKHHASHLHYDFRIELNGVLKSWAVPKGPSMNPQDKRLAIMVEDHPFDYRTFEGTIPEGNYGAGTVMVWDEGTFTVPAAQSASRKDYENKLETELKKGHIEIVLDGQKLKGKFSLILIKNSDKSNNWLLIKGKDEFSNSSDVTNLDRSAQTNRTMDEIAGKKKALKISEGEVKKNG